MYSYDRTRTAALFRPFAQALEKAFLEVSPQLSPYEKGTPQEKAAKSFAKDAIEAFESTLEARIEVWVDKIASGNTKLQFRTVSKGEEYSSYQSDETYYSYEVKYPNVSRLVQKVLLNEAIILKGVMERLNLEVELKNKNNAQTILSHSEVRGAFPAFLENYLKSYKLDGPSFGPLGEAVEKYVGQKMHVTPDSDNEDEYEMGVEGHIRINLQDAKWSVQHEGGLNIVITVDCPVTVDVLWPGDRGYEDYY